MSPEQKEGRKSLRSTDCETEVEEKEVGTETDNSAGNTTFAADVNESEIDQLLFIEGKEYTPEEVLTASLDRSEKFELAVEKTLAVRIDEKYITFEISELECIDISNVNNIASTNE